MTQAPGLPDPDYQPDFYADVPFKRAVAWVIDVIVISLLTAVGVVLTAFLGLLFVPLVYAVVGFVYRVVTIANGSATLGMRVMAIELRDGFGRRLSPLLATWHTIGYYISVASVFGQIASIVLMLTTPRRQGLTDLVLGTVMLNRRADT